MSSSSGDGGAVAHVTGLMFRSGPEPRLRDDVREVLVRRQVVAVFGGMACGSDILVAEVAIALGVDVHVVLPCPLGQFTQASVVVGGERWVPRFEEVVAHAASLHTEPSHALGDAEMFALGDRLAIDRTVAHARAIGASTFQLAVWDGHASSGPAGTGAAVRRWRDRGGETVVIALSRDALVPVRRPPPHATP